MRPLAARRGPLSKRREGLADAPALARERVLALYRPIGSSRLNHLQNADASEFALPRRTAPASGEGRGEGALRS